MASAITLFLLTGGLTPSFISLSPVSLKARLLFSRCRDTPFLSLFCTLSLPGSLLLPFSFYRTIRVWPSSPLLSTEVFPRLHLQAIRSELPQRRWIASMAYRCTTKPSHFKKYPAKWFDCYYDPVFPSQHPIIISTLPSSSPSLRVEINCDSVEGSRSKDSKFTTLIQEVCISPSD